MESLNASKKWTDSGDIVMNKTDRKRKRRRRASVRSGQRLPIASTPLVIRDGMSPDAELERMLVVRGWVAVDRADRYVVYDWPPSEVGGTLDCTHVFIDFNGWSDAPPYRVSLVDCERHIFTKRSDLLANLNAIEARRCPNCGPTTPRLRNEEASRERGALSKHEASQRHGCHAQSSGTSKHQRSGSIRRT